MKTSLSIAAIALALGTGVGAELWMAGRPVHAQDSTAIPKDLPKATADEYKSRIIHYPDLPTVELGKGANSRLIASEQSMVSIIKLDAHSYFVPHRHPQEQIMIVLEGSLDMIIEGKLYPATKGDVIILPPNILHGDHIGDQDVFVIDVFGYPRTDYLIKMMDKMAEMNTKK